MGDGLLASHAGSEPAPRRFDSCSPSVRTLDLLLLQVPGFIWTLFVLVMILACMEPDYYYMDFYGN